MCLEECWSVSLVIPTFNGASRIGSCLSSLQEFAPKHLEIVVVDDGSTDNLPDVVAQFPRVRLITQTNAGPAAARNRGAIETSGEILLFTDDDCVPTSNWVDAMLRPFQESDVVGAKGVYRSTQKRLIARFVQTEYEDKYRIMQAHSQIDFIDTYSAGYRRDRFLEMDGYDTSFPVACAEDVELSYRMSARGWKMKFAPDAVVYHTHPDTLSTYLKKKYKFAFWRVIAVRKNPQKGVKDSHTPQMMKLQLLFGPALFAAITLDLWLHPVIYFTALTLMAFGLTTLPFALRAYKKDAVVGLVSPAILAARALAQFAGVSGGIIYAARKLRESSGKGLLSKTDVGALRLLYLNELSYLSSSERQMIDGLQSIATCSRDVRLKQAVMAHLAESRVHLARITKMMEELGGHDEGKEDASITTLVTSVGVIASEVPAGAVRDAALIALCRRFEHFEIALYSTAVHWARALDLETHERLLAKTLVEEQAADTLLDEISQRNTRAPIAA